MGAAVRRVEATGAVAPLIAWDRYADLDQWSTWAPPIRRVEASPRTLTTGLTGTVVGPLGLRVAFVVTAVDAAAMTWSWVARLGPVALTLHHEVHPDPRGTRTVLLLEGPAPVVTAYAPLARVALLRLVRP